MTVKRAATCSCVTIQRGLQWNALTTGLRKRVAAHSTETNDLSLYADSPVEIEDSPCAGYCRESGVRGQLGHRRRLAGKRRAVAARADLVQQPRQWAAV